MVKNIWVWLKNQRKLKGGATEKMGFNSLTFLYLFLPAALILFNIAPKKLKNSVVAAVSLGFIGFSQPGNFVFFLADIILLFILSKAISANSSVPVFVTCWPISMEKVMTTISVKI